MIPITYRLDSAAEKEYVDKVVPCMEHPETYSKKLESLLYSMGAIGWDILTRAKRFQFDYPKIYCLCQWIVMPYDEMEEIRKYLEGIIIEDLKSLNDSIREIDKSIKGLTSYHDLKARRTKLYSKNPAVKKLLLEAVSYDSIYTAFKDFIKFYKEFPKDSHRVNHWIIEKTGLKVCPYCNIQYTYSRKTKATAQLDHFFPSSEYPIFALCFYNLIPSCPACNRIKSNATEKLASPYKKNAFKDLRITWDYKPSGAEDKYHETDSLTELEERIDIKIETLLKDEKQNLDTMKITDAYQQHKDYASEIIKKIRTYTNPKAQKLICDIGASVGITPDEVERFYLGNYLNESDMKKRPLAKMTRDFYLEIARARGGGGSR